MKNQETLSKSRLGRIRRQGYFNLSNDEISNLAYGNRFAIKLCVGIIALGVVSGSILILFTVMILGVLALALPYHPFDYIYNLLIADGKDHQILPPRPQQSKFVNSIITLWVGQIIYLFAMDLYGAASVVGAILITKLLITITTDYCLFSVLYNALFHTALPHSIYSASKA